MNGIPKEANAEKKGVQADAPEAKELLDIGMIPEPSAGEAVKEALDVAQSVAPEENAGDGGLFWGTDDLDDSASIYQYVEEAEKRAQSLFDHAVSGDRGPLEKLEVLDVAAEFGRPDELAYVGEDLAADDEGQAAMEDTQNLTIGARLRARQGEARGSVAKEDAGASASVHDTELREVFENSETEEDPHPDTPLVADNEKERRRGSAVGLESVPEERHEGDLSQSQVWDLLAALFADKKTGVLVLEGETTTVRLFMDGGDMVMATTTSEKNSLLSALREAGYLDEAQWEALSHRQANAPIERRICATLLLNEMISAADLLALLGRHYRDVAVDTFGWHKGRWRFIPVYAPVREQILLFAETPHLVWEGIRGLHANAMSLPPLLGTAVPTKAANGPFPLEALGLSDEELAVYEAVDGRCAIGALAVRLARDAQSVSRVVAGMAAVGLLDVTHTRAALAASPAHETHVPLDRATVKAKLAQIAEGTYFDILGILQGASEDEVRNAYLTLTDTFRVEYFESDDLADLSDQGRLIRKILDEAYEVLGKSEMRGPYSQAAGDRS